MLVIPTPSQPLSIVNQLSIVNPSPASIISPSSLHYTQFPRPFASNFDIPPFILAFLLPYRYVVPTYLFFTSLHFSLPHSSFTNQKYSNQKYHPFPFFLLHLLLLLLLLLLLSSSLRLLARMVNNSVVMRKSILTEMCRQRKDMCVRLGGGIASGGEGKGGRNQCWYCNHEANWLF